MNFHIFELFHLVFQKRAHKNDRNNYLAMTLLYPAVRITLHPAVQPLKYFIRSQRVIK